VRTPSLAGGSVPASVPSDSRTSLSATRSTGGRPSVASSVAYSRSLAGGAAAGGGRPGDDGEFEDVGLQVGVWGIVAGHAADCLVRAEGADDGDGGLRGLGPGEQVEPPGDEDVGDEDVQVGFVAAGAVAVLGRPDVGVGPGIVAGEGPREAEALVDEAGRRRRARRGARRTRRGLRGHWRV